MEDTPAPLSIEHLSVSYESGPALENINVHVPPASLTAVIGPNGAGKSTLLKAALGLAHAQNGHVKFFGNDLRKTRRRVAYIPQRSAVDWSFPATALDVVMMGLYAEAGWFGRLRADHRDRARACLEQVGLSAFADRQIGALSGGQQQRVFLARALVQNADLYMMDEPLAGVDAVSEQAILNILRQLKSDGRTIICVHHDLQTVGAFFDHVILLNRSLIASGPAQEIMTHDILANAYGHVIVTQ